MGRLKKLNLLPRSHHWKFLNFSFIKERKYHRNIQSLNQFHFSFFPMLTPKSNLYPEIGMFYFHVLHVYTCIKFVSYCFMSLEYVHICFYIICMICYLFFSPKSVFLQIFPYWNMNSRSLILSAVEYSIIWRKYSLFVSLLLRENYFISPW